MKKLVQAFVLLSISASLVSCNDREKEKLLVSDQLKKIDSTKSLGLKCSERTNSIHHKDKPIVIMLSLDGFRADYIEKMNPPSLKKIAQEGIYSPALIPSYPSHTYPNHFSLVTGRTPSSHGILSNKFYDKKRQQMYNAFDDSSDDNSWYEGDPLWNVAERNGMIAHTFHWVGSDIHVNGEDPTCYAPYSDRTTTEERIDTAIQWLQLPAEKRPHLINLYTPDIDKSGHAYGPDSEQVKKAVLEVDQQIGRLWNFIRKSQLPINLVIVSDHGMQENFKDKVIYLSNYTDISEFKMGDKGAIVMLYSDNEFLVQKTYQDLKKHEENFKVYLRNQVPPKYLLNHPDRVGDLVIISKPGHYVTDRNFNPERPAPVGGGSHGWPVHHKSMHALFIAAGSHIEKKSLPLPEIKNIDVYPFILDLLSIKTNQSYDGSNLTLKPYLRKK